MYQVFRIPKRAGGFRIIEAPDPELKLNQQREIYYLKQIYPISPFAHAFQPYKNIVTMAGGHISKDYVGCLDISDFFPSITRDLFTKTAGNSKDVNLKICFHDFGDGKGLRLPQGAPTSPILSNICLYEFDWRIARAAYVLQCDYSRYADDLVFSGNPRSHVRVLFQISEYYLTRLGFKINKKKTKLMHKSARQLVCGVIVNKKINLPRKFRKNLRAEIFQQKGGILKSETEGRKAFTIMVLENKKDFRSSTEILKTLELQKALKNK